MSQSVTGPPKITVAKKQDGTYHSRDFFTTLRQQETGGEPNDGLGAIGDNGMALGPYQIWEQYYQDAYEYDKTLNPRRYRDTLSDTKYSEKVVNAYMLRHSKEEWMRLRRSEGTMADIQRVSRIHNGGPKGYQKPETEEYWAEYTEKWNAGKRTPFNPKDAMSETPQRPTPPKTPPFWTFTTDGQTLGLSQHRIMPGDTLWDISAAHYGTGTHWKKLVSYNGLDPRGHIPKSQHGRIITIPHEVYNHEELWQ